LRRAANFAQEKCVTSAMILKELAGYSSACLRIQLGEIDLARAGLRGGISK
jgi:hypothetical protein